MLKVIITFFLPIQHLLSHSLLEELREIQLSLMDIGGAAVTSVALFSKAWLVVCMYDCRLDCSRFSRGICFLISLLSFTFHCISTTNNVKLYEAQDRYLCEARDMYIYIQEEQVNYVHAKDLDVILRCVH
jgi:hypothetical protein